MINETNAFKKIKSTPLELMDLHVHSTYSDGFLPPDNLMELQKSRGMKLVSITDHDALGGIDGGKKKARELGIDFISGIEISSNLGDIQLHILGYGINKEDKKLNEICKMLEMDRAEKNELIFSIIDRDFDIDIRKALFGKSTNYIGKPDMGRVLIELGFFKNLEDVFANYFRKDEIEGIKRVTIPAAEAIKSIISSGGVPVLAHPILIKGMGDRGSDTFYDHLCELLVELKALGLVGIEADYSKNNRRETKRLLEIAEQQGFIVTRGTDYHG